MARMWPSVVGYLTPVIEKEGRRTPEQVLQALMHGEMQLWVGGDETDELKGAFVTQISNYPLKRSCYVLYIAGEGAIENIDLFGDIEDWARQNGCHEMCLVGRPGWKKVLPDYEFMACGRKALR